MKIKQKVLVASVIVLNMARIVATDCFRTMDEKCARIGAQCNDYTCPYCQLPVQMYVIETSVHEYVEEAPPGIAGFTNFSNNYQCTYKCSGTCPECGEPFTLDKTGAYNQFAWGDCCMGSTQ
jgi:hypothetical protein